MRQYLIGAGAAFALFVALLVLLFLSGCGGSADPVQAPHAASAPVARHPMCSTGACV